jgi:hypothetical protein
MQFRQVFLACANLFLVGGVPLPLKINAFLQKNLLKTLDCR